MRSIRTMTSLTLSLLLGASCNRQKLTVEAVDARVSSAVPVGTHSTRVLAVLDSLQIEHSALDPHTGTVAAMVPDTDRKGMVTRSFHFTFVFDSTGSLVSHSVKEIFTGP
jgi:hypothetical protein